MPRNHVKAKVVKITCAQCGNVSYKSCWRKRPRFCAVACANAFTSALRKGKSSGKPLATRFWERIRKTESCWVWTAGTDGNGYGLISRIGAHRVSWRLHNGPIPSGMMVCHTCDNPPCVRPDHLFLGTRKDNAIDMARKGRWRNGKRVLSASDVKSIRLRHAAGETLTALGRVYNRDRRHIGDIVRGEKWASVT